MTHKLTDKLWEIHSIASKREFDTLITDFMKEHEKELIAGCNWWDMCESKRREQAEWLKKQNWDDFRMFYRLIEQAFGLTDHSKTPDNFNPMATPSASGYLGSSVITEKPTPCEDKDVYAELADLKARVEALERACKIFGIEEGGSNATQTA